MVSPVRPSFINVQFDIARGLIVTNADKKTSLSYIRNMAWFEIKR